MRKRKPFVALMHDRGVAAVVWFVGIVATVLVAAAVVDDRYAKAADMRSQVQAIDRVQGQIEYHADRNRKRLLEDALLRYEMTPERQRTQIDRALAQRYRNEIAEMNERWNKAGQPLK